MFTPDLLANIADVVALLLLLASLGAVYTALAWQARVRGGHAALWLLCACAALAIGYLGYWRTCQTTSCDVRGVDYRVRYGFRYALMAALGFSAASAMIARRARRPQSTAPGRRELLLSAMAFVGGFLLAGGLLIGFHRLTCGDRAYRRPDGSIGSECELYTAGDRDRERTFPGLSNEALQLTSAKSSEGRG